MSSEAKMVELCKNLAVELIPKGITAAAATHGVIIPPETSRIVLKTLITFIELLVEEEKKDDERLNKLIGSYYKVGIDNLTDSRLAKNPEERKRLITTAIDNFRTAKYVEGTSLVMKSQFYIGTCYELLNESLLARKWYERAYKSATQEVTEWHVRPQQLLEFMNPLSQVLLAHNSTLIQKPSPQLTYRTSTLHLIRKSSLFELLAISFIEDVIETDLSGIKINLDGEKVGAIRTGGTFTLDIQPGLHIIFLGDKSEGFFTVLRYFSPRLLFDIVAGEEVTFLCKAKDFTNPMGEGQGILLWKQ